MNRILDKMEKKLGRYAVRNLSLYLIVGYVIGYILYLTGRSSSYAALEFINLNPDLILKGQVWRIVTWVLMPPSITNILFMFFIFLFYYSIGNTLERTWGAFRYNVYIFSGMLFTVLGAFILYGICWITGATNLAVLGNDIGNASTTYYICLSIFLAFAAIFPDHKVLFYFIIPIKIKWLAYLDIVLLAMDFFNLWEFIALLKAGFGFGTSLLIGLTRNYAVKVAIVASLLNFLIFFLSSRKRPHVNPAQMYRRAEYKRQTAQTEKMRAITKHKCAICGRTEEDGDELEFRFCSKCNGNYEYCQDHLFTHTHVQ